ncbi:hypothetical protein STVIR_4159 [Streptomyces viridochromogenes Tue57]|uniref:Uncharacterized protein n=1 Tax=Streptomyces viridochromogenes Tue57 TaxID=1160705 RepID=L8PFY2_STRVR|nr:hypothetical protein STVIR_4159 [Streptomyces viridochromogenes Tue57]
MRSAGGSGDGRGGEAGKMSPSSRSTLLLRLSVGRTHRVRERCAARGE